MMSEAAALYQNLHACADAYLDEQLTVLERKLQQDLGANGSASCALTPKRTDATQVFEANSRNNPPSDARYPAHNCTVQVYAIFNPMDAAIARG